MLPQGHPQRLPHCLQRAPAGLSHLSCVLPEGPRGTEDTQEGTCMGRSPGQRCFPVQFVPRDGRVELGYVQPGLRQAGGRGREDSSAAEEPVWSGSRFSFSALTFIIPSHLLLHQLTLCVFLFLWVPSSLGLWPCTLGCVPCTTPHILEHIEGSAHGCG